MAIAPNILARLQRHEPSAQSEPTAGIPLPALRGSPAQIKWATTIRADALALDWPGDEDALLRRVVDSSWWIANKGVVHSMKFKPPVDAQLEGSASPAVKVAAQADLLDADVIDRQNRAARDAQARVSDAERWAKSVSQNPKLAEAAILAVLSRLYNGTMKTRLRISAQDALDAAGDMLTKDTDAINQMLV